VKRPEHEAIKLTSGRSVKHLLKLRTVTVLAAGVVNELGYDLPILNGAELPQLLKLVLGVLLAVCGGNPGVKCNAQLLFGCHAPTMRQVESSIKGNLHINSCFCADIPVTGKSFTCESLVL